MNLIAHTEGTELKIEASVQLALNVARIGAAVKYIDSPEIMIADTESHDSIVPVRINDHSAYLVFDKLNPHVKIEVKVDGSLIVVDIFDNFPSM